jgi:uncharacterized membrane protein
MLTDVPLGCWLAAAVLDLAGGRRSRRAAQRLIGFGLLAVPSTAASGMADWSGVQETAARRVGAVHAVGNVVVSLLYFSSWRARRRGHHLVGVGLGAVGCGLAMASGYLGRHLAFNLGVGVRDRGLQDSGPSGQQQQPASSQSRDEALAPT